MKRAFILNWFIYALVISVTLQAQPTEKYVKVVVAPDRDNWTYKTGEKVKFTITVLQNGNPLKGVKLRYEIGPEKMEAVKKESAELAKGSLTVDGGTMKTGGFLRCIAVAEVDGREYRGLGTAGFDPQTITPSVANPADFTRFWEDAKAEAAKIPMDTKMTLMPERCTEKVDVYHVNI